MRDLRADLRWKLLPLQALDDVALEHPLPVRGLIVAGGLDLARGHELLARRRDARRGLGRGTRLVSQPTAADGAHVSSLLKPLADDVVRVNGDGRRRCGSPD